MTIARAHLKVVMKEPDFWPNETVTLRVTFSTVSTVIGVITLEASGVVPTDGLCDTWNLNRMASPGRPNGRQMALFPFF
jgi:hypothetical protein